MSDSYYVRSQGKVHGPFTFADLKAKAGKGHLKKTHQVSADRKTWQSARRVEGLFPPPPKLPQQAMREPQEPVFIEPELVEVTLIQEEPPLAAVPEEETEWHYCLQGDERTQGPVSESKLRRLFQSGRLPWDTLVWNDTLSDWVEADRIPALRAGAPGPALAMEFPLIDPGPELVEAGEDFPVPPLASASLILGIIGVFLGVFGSGIGMLALPSQLMGTLGFAVPGALASVLAIVFGHLGQSQIKANRGLFGGENVAKSGLILGYIVLTILLLGGSVGLIVQLAQR